MVSAKGLSSRVSFKAEQWLLGTAALVFGAWFVGISNIPPSATEWLERGDIGTQYAAWQFFRNSPLLQWPITAIPQYGSGWGTIVPGAAGNALAAIPAKYLTRWFDGEFQYFAIWILLSFVLQALISVRILRLFSLSQAQRVLGTIVLTVSPVFIFRLGMTHLDLASHWMLLLAILLYFNANRHFPWLVLISASIAVALYLSVMVVGFWVAWLVQRSVVEPLTRRERPNVAEIIRVGVFGIATIAISMWVLGLFSLAESSRGAGFFRLNVLAWANSDFSSGDSYSFLARQIPYLRTRQLFAEEGEGFAYLGSISAAALPTLVVMAIRYRATVVRKMLPITLIAFAFWLFAVSNRVVIGRTEFTLWAPQVVTEIRQVFRATPRFVWPLSYLVIIGGWVSIARLSRRVNSAVAIVALSLLVMLHVIDSAPGIHWSHERLSSSEPSTNRLLSKDWEEIFIERSAISLVPSIDLQLDSDDAAVAAWIDSGRWMDILNFASKKNLTLNFAYQGRSRGDLANRATTKARGELLSGELRSGVVYFFSTEAEWSLASRQLSNERLARIIDGYHVILGPEER